MMHVLPRLFALVVCASVALAAGACSSSGSPSTNPATSVGGNSSHVLRLDTGSSGKIKHIILVIQENRSFDNIFAGFPNADAPTYGYTHDGTKVNLTQITFKGLSLAHGFETSITDWDNGKMDGFDKTTPSSPLFPYSFLKRKLVQPYWAMAQQYALVDHMFPTQFGGSFSAHLNLIAGTDKLTSTTAVTDWASNTPWGCDAPAGTKAFIVNTSRQESKKGPFPCFTQFKTMADTLDDAGVKWKYYAPKTFGCPVHCDNGGLEWSAFDAINKVRYGADWANVINPQTQILQDAMNNALAPVSWVVPDHKDSDHPDTDSDTGPSWVASVVNAIGESQEWNSSAIVVLWDDWGGWYDDVPPPQPDYLGLGIRVGCIIISPYAKNEVVHTQYEYGSILKFIEQTFHAKTLGSTDQRSTSISDSFDFTQTPRPFSPIPAKYPPAHFMNERPSLRAVDDQ